MTWRVFDPEDRGTWPKMGVDVYWYWPEGDDSRQAWVKDGGKTAAYFAEDDASEGRIKTTSYWRPAFPPPGEEGETIEVRCAVAVIGDDWAVFGVGTDSDRGMKDSARRVLNEVEPDCVRMAVIHVPVPREPPVLVGRVCDAD